MKVISHIRRLSSRQDGASLAELALVLPLLILILLGAIDFARAYYLSIELCGAAQAGAMYGVQNRTDTAGIEAAAADNAPNVSNLVVAAPTWGCECSDGSGSSSSCTAKPSCSDDMVYWVKVSASANYTPVFPWPHIPSSLSLSQTAVLRSAN